jgi:8-oxo-dGTP pyrophosphatase MutT (NUDIX family)
MRAWRPETAESLFRHRLLTLERRRLVAGGDRREALVLDAPDWVNVIALRDDGRVLLVRQWRFGIDAPTLEIPGGLVEERDTRQAAARELEEETGYRARRWQRLGALHPNPALQSNLLTTYLATDLERLGEPQGAGGEEVELTSAALDEIPRLIAEGKITHALVVAAFYLLDRRWPRGML